MCIWHIYASVHVCLYIRVALTLKNELCPSTHSRSHVYAYMHLCMYVCIFVWHLHSKMNCVPARIPGVTLICNWQRSGCLSVSPSTHNNLHVCMCVCIGNALAAFLFRHPHITICMYVCVYVLATLRLPFCFAIHT